MIIQEERRCTHFDEMNENVQKEGVRSDYYMKPWRAELR